MIDADDAGYRIIVLVHQKGVKARLDGLPCTPPEGYDISVGLDLEGIWIAGWEQADRELQGASRPLDGGDHDRI